MECGILESFWQNKKNILVSELWLTYLEIVEASTVSEYRIRTVILHFKFENGSAKPEVLAWRILATKIKIATEKIKAK